MIIHISGFPGSGKTTLGEKIQKLYPKIVVYDTDGFIQSYTKEGKKLLKMEEMIKKKKATWTQYKKFWKETLDIKIEEFINKHRNKMIVFVGSLDNFGPPNTIYKIKADYKIMLDVSLPEIMKRYYLRIYLMEQKVTKKESNDYWNKLSKGIYHINGSDNMIKDYEKYTKWHKTNGYKSMSDVHIIDFIKKLIKYQ